MATLKRRRWFARSCVAGVLAVETTIAKDADRWSLHAHGCVDVRLTGIDLMAWCVRVQDEWADIVERPSAVFDVEPLGCSTALLRYGLKVGAEKSWAPLEVAPWMRAHVDVALYRKKLIISWGSRSK